MTLTDIANYRLASQQISGTGFRTVKDLVGWMGAIQAQDLAMSTWAVGVRLPGSDVGLIEQAIDSAEIIRTHVMRPTWHLVSADDIYWMLALTAPRIRSSLKSRHKELELTEPLLSKSNEIIKRSLTGGKHLSRKELVSILGNAGIATDNGRASHLFFWAELNGIICSGAVKENLPTYALLSERVPETRQPDRDESLAMLARKYFSSHGPATLQDFTWWSGLSATDSMNALEMVKPKLVSEKAGNTTYWLNGSHHAKVESNSTAFLLPAYDEFLISYRERGASLTPEIGKKTVSDNGIFRPVVVINGLVKGLWKRTITNAKVHVAINLFQQPDKKTRNIIEEKAVIFGSFLNKTTGIAISTLTKTNKP